MVISEDILHALESLLVKEFRNCQALDRLTRDERAALAQGQTADLLAITSRKQALLDRLIQLESSKQVLFQSLASALGNPALAAQPQQLMQLLSSEQAAHAAQLGQLQDGILALSGRVREQTRSNRALVRRALKRANALQNYLIGLCKLPLHNEETQPLSSETTLPAVLAAAVEARRALDGSDRGALRAAALSLQEALDNLNAFLKSSASLSRLPGLEERPLGFASALSEGLPPPRAGSAEANEDLVEFIADLYRQETAYQAVLQISNRMLASI